MSVTSTSLAKSCFARSAPVSVVVETMNCRPGARCFNSAINAGTTFTSPTLTAWIMTQGPAVRVGTSRDIRPRRAEQTLRRAEDLIIQNGAAITNPVA